MGIFLCNADENVFNLFILSLKSIKMTLNVNDDLFCPVKHPVQAHDTYSVKVKHKYELKSRAKDRSPQDLCSFT